MHKRLLAFARRCRSAPGLFAGLTRRSPFVVVALLVVGVFGWADIVVLKDGRRIEGKVVKKTADVVEVETDFGATLTFDRSDVKEILKSKTRREKYEEKRKACSSADDFHALGVWCKENRMRRESKRAFEKAIEVDPDHAEARAALGFVQHEGEWVTPEERDRRVAAKEAAAKEAAGLVLHEGKWIPAADKERLEQGLLLYEGRWLPEDEVMRRRGFERYQDRWVPRAQAAALRTHAEISESAIGELNLILGSNAFVCGTVPHDMLRKIDSGLDRGRTWFDETWQAVPGLKLLGNRLAEFYVFDDDNAYESTVPYLAKRMNYLPPGWVEAVQKTFGFVWTDPFAVSSARLRTRPDKDLVGHCYHHWGHLLINRLGYSGRLLPAWYDEGMASLTELRIHGENAVFCRSSFSEGFGSASNTSRPKFDTNLMRDGSWRARLKEAIRKGQVEPFDKLARREFSQLDLIDIATSMAILEWLESREEGALARFHKRLRKDAPPAPQRVITAGGQRQAYYNAAFEDAVQMGFREADGAWRTWFLNR